MPLSREKIIDNIEDLMRSLAMSQETRDEALKICGDLADDKLAEVAVILRTRKARLEKLVADPQALTEVKKTMKNIKALADKYGISS